MVSNIVMIAMQRNDEKAITQTLYEINIIRHEQLIEFLRN